MPPPSPESRPAPDPHDPPEPFTSAPLGPVEDLFWRLGEQMGGARIAVVVRLDGCLEPDVLRTALLRLQRRHPKLRAVIEAQPDGRHRYHFDRTVTPIPLTIVEDDGEETRWREETARLLRAGFAGEGPLAAVTVLRSRTRQRSELLLCAHHTIADGRSAIMLIDELLTEYAATESTPDAPFRPTLLPVTAPRATSPGGWRNRWWMTRRIVRLQREDRRSRQTPLPQAGNIPPQSQWAHWVLSGEDTRALVRRCRKEHASLGAALLAAACCALMDCLPLSKARFKCQFPFDLRDGLAGVSGPVAAQDLGCFVSAMNEYYAVSRPPVLWELARRAHQDVQAFVQRGAPALYYNLAGRRRRAWWRGPCRRAPLARRASRCWSPATG